MNFEEILDQVEAHAAANGLEDDFYTAALELDYGSFADPSFAGQIENAILARQGII